MRFSRSVSAAASALLLSGRVLAQGNSEVTDGNVDPLAKAAYFTAQTASGEYVAALNFVQNGDFYLHMSSPYENSWVGVGIGSSMVDALHIIAYKSSNGTGVTTSARFSTGHSEPAHIEDSRVEKIFSDLYGPNSNVAVPGGIMISHIVCKNCTQYLPAPLDYASPAQRMIFAVGPKKSLKSDSLEAPLSRHAVYGHFTLNMTAATSPLDYPERWPDYGRVPAPDDVASPIEDSGGFNIQHGTLLDMETDSDPMPIVHAIVMSVAFILIFPLGALLLRLAHKVLYHAVAQTVGIVFVIVGLGTGVRTSYEYNRSKDFNSVHQAIGLLVFVLLAFQLGLGLIGHSIFKKTKKPSILSKIHLFLGPSIILLALINGGLGIDLAAEDKAKIPYGIIVAVLFLLFVAARIYLHIFNRHQHYAPDPDAVEDYKRTQSFGLSPTGDVEQEVRIPEPYHEEQTPVSAVSAGRAFPFSPVSMAPPTPSWPGYSGARPSGLQRSASGASDRSSIISEHESFIGQDKAFELERRHG